MSPLRTPSLRSPQHSNWGRTGFELDVRRTSEGHVVVIQDAMLERTTTGAGPVFEATLDEIPALDADRWFGPRFVGAQVPLLSEVPALTAKCSNSESGRFGRFADERGQCP